MAIFNNTSYKNEKGKDIPANAAVAYRRNYYGIKVPSSSTAATDTIVTLTPDAPGATTQRIHLAGNKSKSEHLDNAGTWVPSEFQNYWISRGREAVQNIGNQPSYWNQFIKKIGFKQQGGTMNKINYFQQGGAAPKQQDMQQQLIALVQAAIQGDEKATNAINQILEAAKAGDQQAMQLAQMIQQITKQMQGQATSAKWGAKLSYIRSLKYAKGGKACPTCQAGSPIQPVQKVEEKACGGVAKKAKKAKKRYFGGWL